MSGDGQEQKERGEYPNRGLAFTPEPNIRTQNTYTRMNGARLPRLEVPRGLTLRQFLDIQTCHGD